MARPIETLTLPDTLTLPGDGLQARTRLMPLYHTVVHNCACHTFQDVIFGLMRIVGTGMRDAELKAKEIDFFGRGVVATTTLEVAELYSERLHKEVVSASGTLLGTSIEPA